MTKSKPIMIACPGQNRLVRGWYECDERGRYRLNGDGTFSFALARCCQDDGRCMQTLCVLHRFNRRGPGSWYPSHIRALPEKAGSADIPGQRVPRDPSAGGAIDEVV